jgi:hypothetical protein
MKITFTRFKELEKDKQENEAKMKERDDERMKDILSKTSINPKILPIPIPANFTTFERLSQSYALLGKEKSSKKSLGFGVGPRIPLSNKEKWQAKVEKYNVNAATALDPKMDPLPAPNAYSLISHWPGKKSKKASKSDQATLPNILSKISKGPSISPYYVKLK